MIEKIIRKYVEKLRPEDIIAFAKQNNIYLTDTEVNYLYYTIQTKWENVVFGNPDKILKEAKQTLNPKIYDKIEELLFFYREKYKNYL